MENSFVVVSRCGQREEVVARLRDQVAVYLALDLSVRCVKRDRHCWSVAFGNGAGSRCEASTNDGNGNVSGGKDAVLRSSFLKRHYGLIILRDRVLASARIDARSFESFERIKTKNCTKLHQEKNKSGKLK
jgi:hypothetical protein